MKLRSKARERAAKNLAHKIFFIGCKYTSSPDCTRGIFLPWVYLHLTVLAPSGAFGKGKTP